MNPVVVPVMQPPMAPTQFTGYRPVAYRTRLTTTAEPAIIDPNINLLNAAAMQEFKLAANKKPFYRKAADYNSSVIMTLENRIWQRDLRDRPLLQPDDGYAPHVCLPNFMPENSSNAITTKFIRTAMNKMKCPVFSITWTPEGRRLLTGSSSGEFTLWNGILFNFETILQAHDAPIRTMMWSNNGQWLLSGDHNGFVKYWQNNMNNVKMFQAHREPMRDLSFSPTDMKFASCSDDATVRIWDFFTGSEERILRGHGADCKTVDWHHTKSIIASGSKDGSQPIKIWDPKSGKSIVTLYPHKAAVTELKFSPNGNWLLSASRDHMLKLFDIRNLKEELQTFRGHKKDVITMQWHPFYEGCIVSGGADGSILFWNVGLEKQIGAIENAHDGIIWSLAWHPFGHVLASGSNDFTSKFWTRNDPGDKMRDKYNLNLGDDDMMGGEDVEIVPIMSSSKHTEVATTTAAATVTPTTNVETPAVATIPGLNPEEVKENQTTNKPITFQHNRGEQEKLKKGSKKIDAQFKYMWNSYQRPDLYQNDQEVANNPQKLFTPNFPVQNQSADVNQQPGLNINASQSLFHKPSLHVPQPNAFQVPPPTLMDVDNRPKPEPNNYSDKDDRFFTPRPFLQPRNIEPPPPRFQEMPRFGEPRFHEPFFQEPRFPDPRFQEPRFQEPRFQEPRFQEPRFQEPRFQEPRFQEPRFQEPRFHEPRFQEPRFPDPRFNEPRFQNGPNFHNPPRPHFGRGMPPEVSRSRPLLPAPPHPDGQFRPNNFHDNSFIRPNNDFHRNPRGPRPFYG